MGRWWVTDVLSQPDGQVLLGSWVVWVIGSIVLHELAHGWAAIWCGDRTPIEMGHMTWNPLVHMGPVSLIMFALVGIAWGAMPVSPSRFRRRYDDALVSLAGPAMNVLLALIAGIVGGLWYVVGARIAADNVQDNVRIFLWIGTSLNIALALFNLVPVPPLDGSKIAARFFPAYERFIHSEQGAVASMIGFALLFFFSGGVLFRTAQVAGHFVTDQSQRLFVAMFGAPP